MSEVDENRMKEQFPSNSYTEIRPREDISGSKALPPPKESEKKKPKVKEPKRTIGERLADNFLNFDTERIKERLIFEWLFPEIISSVDDMLRMIFFGDRRGGRRDRDRDRRSGYTNYNSIYDGDRRRDRYDDRSRDRDPTRQNFRRIRLEFYEREDAEEVLDQLRESLEESSSGWVTVKELYSFSDLPTNSAMYNWGWNDLEDCMITRYGDNYVLEMPRAEVIER